MLVLVLVLLLVLLLLLLLLLLADQVRDGTYSALPVRCSARAMALRP